MASGRDSHDTYKVSCTLDNVQCSYKHFVFLGEKLKMAAPPRPHRDPKTKDLNNFEPKRVKNTHSDFNENPIKSLGGDR